MSHLRTTPELFVKKALLSAFYLSVGLTVLLFFLFSKIKMPLVWLLAIFPALFLFFYMFVIHSVDATIRKREREINMEVLFAGRYLLVKMESGTPLFNALIDASRSYGVSAK